MYKLCKTEQSAKRQKLLEKGLLEAMHSQCYEDISVSDLCQKMGISRKSFYRYFSGKEGALEALLEHTLMEFGTFCMSGEESITPEKYDTDKIPRLNALQIDFMHRRCYNL